VSAPRVEDATCSHVETTYGQSDQTSDSESVTCEGRLTGGREEAEGELLYREREEVEAMDRTFHSFRSGRLKISELDPSLSLCFLCHTEQDFDNLCIGKTQAYSSNFFLRVEIKFFLTFFCRVMSWLLCMGYRF
jgi:hypothetical protein